MIDIRDHERKLLHEMRAVLSPTRTDRERLGARLAASLSLGASSSPETPLEARHTPSASEPVGALAEGIRGLGAQMLAAVLVAAAGFGAGYVSGLSRSTDAAPSPAPPPRTEDVRATPSFPPSPRSEPAGDVRPPARVPKNVPAPSSAVTHAPSTQTLSEEARELQRVDRALRSGTPALALGILSDLDQRIPRGVLLEERAAARLMARCQNGDVLAPKAAAAWLERHAQSVYAPRLEAACTDEAER